MDVDSIYEFDRVYAENTRKIQLIRSALGISM